jgi:hypothetical protein
MDELPAGSARFLDECSWRGYLSCVRELAAHQPRAINLADRFSLHLSQFLGLHHRCCSMCASAHRFPLELCRIVGQGTKDQTMSTIRKAHLRRLTATILIGFAILLPALFGRAPAQTDAPAGKPAAAIVLSSAPAL